MTTVAQTKDQYSDQPRAEAGWGQLTNVMGKLGTALAFEVLTIVVNIYLALTVTGVSFAVATKDNVSGVAAHFNDPSNGGIAALLLLGVGVTVIVMSRTVRMLRAASRGDIAVLKRLNSDGWAIVALIFSGLVQGLLLLGASGAIKTLDSELR